MFVVYGIYVRAVFSQHTYRASNGLQFEVREARGADVPGTGLHENPQWGPHF